MRSIRVSVTMAIARWPFAGEDRAFTGTGGQSDDAIVPMIASAAFASKPSRIFTIGSPRRSTNSETVTIQKDFDDPGIIQSRADVLA